MAHRHSYSVVSRTMISGDRVRITYRCTGCPDEYTETEPS